MWILILGECTHLTRILSSIEINHQGNQQGIGNTVWQVMECTQLMSHGVAYAQECIGKRHTSHTGSIRHLLTRLNICRLIVSCWKVIKYVLHGLKCKAVCIVGSHDGCICLQCMGQYVNAGCAGQTFRLAHHVVCINDCHVRQKRIVCQRILDTGLLVCDNCERSNLGTCTGGSRNSDEICFLAHLREGVYTFPDEAHGHIHEIHFRMLIQHPHNLARVHSGTAAHSQDYIRLKFSHELGASLCVSQCGVRLYIGEYGICDSHFAQTVCDDMGVSVLIQEGVCYDERPLLA